MVNNDGDGNDTFGNEDDIFDISQQFHNTVRENIIFLLFFLTLGIISWTVIGMFLRKKEKDPRSNLRSAPLSADDDDSVVYRICFWLCVFSLSISMGAALLLPISIVSNEVLLLYPKTYYVQWLNGMLIQGLWNLIFLFANISLFVLLPFSYLFIKSEGFSGQKKGLSAKFYEAIVVLTLVGFTVWGMAYVLAALLSPERIAFGGILTFLTFGFVDQLPFIYSCISFIGVLLLLLCTPLGFAHLFTVLSQLMVGPQFLRNLEEECVIAHLEVESLKNKLNQKIENSNKVSFKWSSTNHSSTAKNNSTSNNKKRSSKNNKNFDSNNKTEQSQNNQEFFKKYNHMTSVLPSKEDEEDEDDMRNRITNMEKELEVLEKLKKTPGWKRNLLYPLAFLFVLVLTALAVFMVILNTLQLVVGLKALPLTAQTFSLGLSSMSVLGPWGAMVEVVLIIYLMTTSLIGLYHNLPGVVKLRPRLGDTPTSHVIYNCGLVLIFSSALPVLARILGITNFDLLGNYGKIEWLGNFYIVLLYNVVFSAASTLLLVTKFTSAIRQELLTRLRSAFRFSKSTNYKSNAGNATPSLVNGDVIGRNAKDQLEAGDCNIKKED